MHNSLKSEAVNRIDLHIRRNGTAHAVDGRGTRESEEIFPT